MLEIIENATGRTLVKTLRDGMIKAKKQGVPALLLYNIVTRMQNKEIVPIATDNGLRYSYYGDKYTIYVYENKEVFLLIDFSCLLY